MGGRVAGHAAHAPGAAPAASDSPQHLHAALLTEMLRLARFDATFILVRDPVMRFCSEYVMRNKRQPGAGRAEHVEAWTLEALARLERNPAVLDNHLRPQHQFVVLDSQVYRFEDGLASALADLSDRFSLSLPTAAPHTSLRAVPKAAYRRATSS